MDYAIKDSGKRTEFPTGSVRDIREGKGRYDLIAPFALHRLAKHYEKGALKYEARNWEKGQTLHSYIDSALRHVNDYMMGMRDEDHIIAAVWNLMAFVDTQERIERKILPEELNDMPFNNK